MAGKRGTWLLSVFAYSVAGSVSSVVVGAFLGWMGRLLLPAQMSAVHFVVPLLVAATALARDLGWRQVPFPQLKRQTRSTWARRFPLPIPPILWGADIGLMFSTWLTFPAVWVFVVTALFTRNAAFAGALFMAYWLGRALSVWLAPLLMEDACSTSQVLASIRQVRRSLQWPHRLVLGWSLLVLVVWMGQSQMV